MLQGIRGRYMVIIFVSSHTTPCHCPSHGSALTPQPGREGDPREACKALIAATRPTERKMPELEITKPLKNIFIYFF